MRAAALLRLAAVAMLASCIWAVCGAAAARSGTYDRLVQYPEAGFGGFDRQIVQARRTIDMEMYELSDPAVEHDLVAAAGRGIRVRVLLDQDFSGAKVNAAAFEYLSHHGVDVRWAPAGYIFHIKATTFDRVTSDVSSANLVSRYYPTTRDAEIVDTDPVQVSAIEQTFAGDWAAGPSGSPGDDTVQAPGLVWSPNTGSGTAQTALVKEIAAARHSIEFESEELSDPAIYEALAADARRGVRCRIVMTDSSEWNTAFAAVTAAGCQVHVLADTETGLYIHEKLILDDLGSANESMFLGSQNASVTSLTRNRELGILLGRAHGGASAMTSAGATFAADSHRASPWRRVAGRPGPAPSPPACHPRSAAGNCYEPGEDCADADHGMAGVAGDGEPIVCRDEDGWRWEPR